MERSSEPAGGSWWSEGSQGAPRLSQAGTRVLAGGRRPRLSPLAFGFSLAAPTWLSHLAGERLWTGLGLLLTVRKQHLSSGQSLALAPRSRWVSAENRS